MAITATLLLDIAGLAVVVPSGDGAIVVALTVALVIALFIDAILEKISIPRSPRDRRADEQTS